MFRKWRALSVILITMLYIWLNEATESEERRNKNDACISTTGDVRYFMILMCINQSAIIRTNFDFGSNKQIIRDKIMHNEIIYIFYTL